MTQLSEQEGRGLDVDDEVERMDLPSHGLLSKLSN